jgi:hypothetical protein
MNQYKRPEKETDPAKYPGVVNYNQLPSGREKMKDGCCHQTVLAGERCSDCSFRDPQTGSIGSPRKLEEWEYKECTCGPEGDCDMHDGRGG